MKVLVACEFSAVVRDAFRRAGHDAWSCDLLPTEGEPYWHWQRDAFWAIDLQEWDLMIAHPPCTYLANSGVRWLYTQCGRRDRMAEAAKFFKRLLEAPIPRIAIENPIMHKHGIEIIGRRQDQTIQPWQFGHGETKAVCLWLKNLPPLKPTEIVEGRQPRVHHASPGPERWKERSRFYRGIAEAFASQWGSLPLIHKHHDRTD